MVRSQLLTCKIFICFVCQHATCLSTVCYCWNTSSLASRWLFTDFFVAAETCLAKPLTSDSRIFWFQYSGFQAARHNMIIITIIQGWGHYTEPSARPQQSGDFLIGPPSTQGERPCSVMRCHNVLPCWSGIIKEEKRVGIIWLNCRLG
jgi:hypothetical protein